MVTIKERFFQEMGHKEKFRAVVEENKKLKLQLNND
jgi:hypothetical protein